MAKRIVSIDGPAKCRSWIVVNYGLGDGSLAVKVISVAGQARLSVMAREKRTDEMRFYSRGFIKGVIVDEKRIAKLQKKYYFKKRRK